MGRPRGIGKTGAGAIELAERKARAIQLRKQNIPVKDIADEMGLDPSTIYYYINDISLAIRKSTEKDMMEIRQIQLERLEIFADSIHEILANPTGDTPYEKQGRRLMAIQTGLKVMERTARLLGLDAPVKTQLVDTPPTNIVFNIVDNVNDK